MEDGGREMYHGRMFCFYIPAHHELSQSFFFWLFLVRGFGGAALSTPGISSRENRRIGKETLLIRATCRRSLSLLSLYPMARDVSPNRCLQRRGLPRTSFCSPGARDKGTPLSTKARELRFVVYDNPNPPHPGGGSAAQERDRASALNASITIPPPRLTPSWMSVSSFGS